MGGRHRLSHIGHFSGYLLDRARLAFADGAGRAQLRFRPRLARRSRAGPSFRTAVGRSARSPSAGRCRPYDALRRLLSGGNHLWIDRCGRGFPWPCSRHGWGHWIVLSLRPAMRHSGPCRRLCCTRHGHHCRAQYCAAFGLSGPRHCRSCLYRQTSRPAMAQPRCIGRRVLVGPRPFDWRRGGQQRCRLGRLLDHRAWRAHPAPIIEHVTAAACPAWRSGHCQPANGWAGLSGRFCAAHLGALLAARRSAGRLGMEPSDLARGQWDRRRRRGQLAAALARASRARFCFSDLSDHSAGLRAAAGSIVAAKGAQFRSLANCCDSARNRSCGLFANGHPMERAAA